MSQDQSLAIHFEPGAGAVVFRESEGKTELLVVHRVKQNDITLPKGHIEANESLQETAKREVLEETGYEIELGEIVDRFEYKVLKEEEGREYWRLIYFFVATPVSQSAPVFNPEEVDEVMWIDVEQVNQKLSYENDNSIVQKALDAYKKSQD